MLQEAKDLQNNAVEKLVNITLEDRKREINFKAPTGVGKTYMMADYMNRILANNNHIVFIVSTLSRGKLAEQTYNRFLEYAQNKTFPFLKPFIISTEKSSEERLYIPNDCNVYVLPQDLHKKTTDLIKDGAFERFLEDIRPNILNNYLGKDIYLIRDESHRETKNLSSIADKYFNKIINFSATPKPNTYIDVEITEKEAEDTKIIKKVEYIESEDNNELLESAIRRFWDTKEKYFNLLKSEPCLMIQISNQEDGEKEKEEITSLIKNMDNTEIKWVALYSKVDKDKNGNPKVDKNGKTKIINAYDSNDKIKNLPKDKWLEYVKEPLSTISVIIFKLSVAEGFDIPRANMLYQRRMTESDQLDKQVLGRIRRNPRLVDFENVKDEETIDLCTHAVAWGIKPKEDNVKVELRNIDRTKDEIKIKTTRLKTLAKSSEININEILDNNKEEKIKSIFELYREYYNSNTTIKNMCNEYASDYQKWIKFSNNISNIKKKLNAKICDYDSSMYITQDENGNEVPFSLPNQSAFYESDDAKVKSNIRNSLWIRLDKNEEFSFDSEAENKWVEIMKELCNTSIPNSDDRIVKRIVSTIDNFFWGKNYLQNSEIKYEYYLDGTHFSYPDFVMKDSFNKIHIFEVKSISKNDKTSINKEEYENKIEALKKCYMAASKITEHVFYIPIYDYETNQWNIHRYKNGEYKEYINKDNFIEDLKYV